MDRDGAISVESRLGPGGFAARAALAAAAILLAAAGPARGAPSAGTIVVSHSVLGSVVKDLVGDRVEVRVAIPNGMDPHEYEPSARDVEALTRADLVVVNGLGLEEGMQRALEQARRRGVRIFTAADHVAVRRVQPDELPSDDHGHGDRHAAGGLDPHFWTDPVAMASMARALAAELRGGLGVDLSPRLADLERRLGALDTEIRTTLAAVPPGQRKLVTGHESMGYFAQRYGFRVVGAVVPGLSSQAETSAADLSALKALVARERVRVLFTEAGTPARVVQVLARESGVKCVTLTTHAVPPDGSYFTFMRNLAGTIASNLR